MPMYDCQGCGQAANSELQSCPACGLLRFWQPDNPPRFSKCHSCGQVLIWRDAPDRCPNVACQQIDPLVPRYGQLSPREKATTFLSRNYPTLVPVVGWGLFAFIVVPKLDSVSARFFSIGGIAIGCMISLVVLHVADRVIRSIVKFVRGLGR